MFKYFKKDFATSLTAVSFVVVSVTGLFLYFRFLSSYVKDMHEILGLVFVLGALLHIFYNFKLMNRYFSKNTFRVIALILVISSVYLLNLNNDKKDKISKLNKIFINSPISQSAKILGINDEKIQEKLNLLNISSNKSLKEISASTNKKTKDIIKLLIE